MAHRQNTTVYTAQSLAASTTLADIKAAPINQGGHVSIQCVIARADRTTAPSDTPVGVWQLWFSSDGENYTLVTDADIAAELAKIAPNGNNVVDAYAVFEQAPGSSVKVRYLATSGGGTNAVTFLNVTT